MPQLQLPVFPEGVTHLTPEIAFERADGWVTYIHGLAPVFRHEEKDIASFRLFTSQLIAQGLVQQSEVVRVFGVPRITVMRAVKLYREQGPKGFFRQRRTRGAGVLKGETHRQVQALLDAGQSVPEVGRQSGVPPNTLHKAIRQGRLHQARKDAGTVVAPTTTKSERSEIDSAAVMGYATTRSEERVAASMGALAAAPIRFEAAHDVPHGILAALVGFCFLIRGFTNRQLVHRVRDFLQTPYTSRQATYDLRRLRRTGWVEFYPESSLPHRAVTARTGRGFAG